MMLPWPPDVGVVLPDLGQLHQGRRDVFPPLALKSGVSTPDGTRRTKKIPALDLRTRSGSFQGLPGGLFYGFMAILAIWGRGTCGAIKFVNKTKSVNIPVFSVFFFFQTWQPCLLPLAAI